MRVIILSCLLIASATGSELWVDGEKGDDANPGTRERPFASIDAGLKQLVPGTTLHILPRMEPWPTDIRITVSGTEDAPIIVDGHGSLASGRSEVPLKEWESMGEGVYRRALPNNAWGMPHYWEGGFPLVWFDDEPGRNVNRREDLAEGCFFLYKNQPELKTDEAHNTLFIRLPGTASPEKTKIEAIVGEGGIFVGGDHVVVRNFVVEYGGRDGYATHRNVGVVFENVEARYFMDQGMSHHGAEVVVRNAHFHHNAGAGIVDVYPEAKVRYENCAIENDTWRGGVEFHSGQFEMVNCHVKGNPKKSITVTRGAKVTLTNCLIEGGAEGGIGIGLSEGSTLEMIRSSVQNFETGLQATFSADTQLRIEKCAFLQNEMQMKVSATQRRGAAEVRLKEQMSLQQNEYDNAPFTLVKKREGDTGWTLESVVFEQEDLERFREQVGDQGSVFVDRQANAGADESALPHANQ